MRTQRERVDYALQRRALLADVRSGRISPNEVRDADPYLVRAAKFHGEPTTNDCPLCRKTPLTEVHWIFGDQLGRANGSARSLREVSNLIDKFDEFTVHVVEVCRACRWNHLVRSYVLGRAGGNTGTATKPSSASAGH